MSPDTINADDPCKAAVLRIRLALPKIIDKLIAKAEEGSCQHAKFLFEFADKALQAEEAEDDELTAFVTAQMAAEERALAQSEANGADVE
jgi:hypothetical protein